MFAALGPFLAAMVGPLAAIVLTSLGIGFVTVIGVNFAVDALLQAAANSLLSVNPKVGIVLGMSGFYDVMSILSGAVTACLTLVTLKKMSPL